MELEIPVGQLLPVLRVIDLVPNIPGFPTSTFVRLGMAGNKLMLTLSAELHGSVHVETKPTVALKKDIFCDRNLLFPFLFAAEHIKSEKPFLFSLNDGRLIVRHGRRKGQFDCADRGAGYHEAEFSDKGSPLELPEKVLAKMQLAATCATNETSRPELNCVLMRHVDGGVEFYGTNQLLAFSARQKMKVLAPDLLALPLVVVPYMKTEGLKEIRLHKQEIALQFDCGVLWHPLSAKAQKEFPHGALDDLFAKANDYPLNFKMRVKRLEQVIGRFGLYLASAKKEDWLLHMKANEGDKQVTLDVKIPQGHFVERITLEELVKKVHLKLNGRWTFCCQFSISCSSSKMQCSKCIAAQRLPIC